MKAVGCFDHVVPLLIRSTGKWLQAGNFISVLSEQNKQRRKLTVRNGTVRGGEVRDIVSLKAGKAANSVPSTESESKKSDMSVYKAFDLKARQGSGRLGLSKQAKRGGPRQRQNGTSKRFSN